MRNNHLFKLVLCFILPFSIYSQTSNVSGTLKKWHKIAVTVDLPGDLLDETSATFRDHRLDVIFTDPSGNETRVPGFFAADGNAANTSANKGNKFIAYLRPNVTGVWTYRVLYYRESGVAPKWVNQLPSPIYTLNGTVGNISASDKAAPDFRSKGRLKYQLQGSTNQRRYLRFEDSGEYFLKLGPDSPENLLNYDDFDYEGSRNPCGRCLAHTYSPHSANYNSGDPTWSDGKGKNIMGVLNYLKNEKMNAVSMSLFGGDDLNVFPWTTSANRTSYDVSKLAQWELVFDHAERNGLLLHFKLAENENWDALDLSELRVYYREMIARFGHHLAIEWNFSEEYRGTAESAIPRIDWLAATDPWQNHRVIHTFPGEHKKYQDWLNLDAKLTGASIQTSSIDDYNGAFSGDDGILTWINNSKTANKPWVVSSDEQNSGERGVFTSMEITNSNVVKEARTRILWKALVAGGAGVMWYGGARGDFFTEDFSRFETLFKWSRYAIVDFFEKNEIAFWNMQNDDGLVSANNAHCLADKGSDYVIYLENGGSTNIDLSGSNMEFNIGWFDPRNGGTLQKGSITSLAGGSSSVNIGNPPNEATSDWIVLVTSGEVATGGNSNPTEPFECDADFVEQDKRVVIEAENLNLTGTSWVKKTDKSDNTGSGHISWNGENNFAKPGNEKLTASIQITNPGKYRFQWRNAFGKGVNTTEHNDSWLRFPDASDFYAEQGTSKVYPLGSGKTPNAAKGGGADGWFKVWLAGDGNWSWYSRTWDTNSHFIYVEFDEPGIYTMEISGRSQYHLLDRIILYQEGVDAQNTLLTETVCSTEVTNIPPTAKFTSPGNGTKFKVNDTMTFTVNASDVDGTISNVLFFANGVYIGADDSYPYTITQTALNIGAYSIAASVTDNDGGKVNSEILSVEIVEDQVPSTLPKVQLTGITNGGTYTLDEEVNIGATASDDGFIKKVEFFVKDGLVKIGEDTTVDYNTVFKPAFSGTYIVTAKASDNQGNVTTSAPVSIVIKERTRQVDAMPSVVLTGINGGTNYEIRDGLNISANATDTNGSITKVVFYAKGVVNLGEITAPPYTVKFTPAFTGDYVITAKATDNTGNVTTSAPITVTFVNTAIAAPLIQNAPTVTTENVALEPIHDAYLDYNNGLNTTIIRVENGRREGYFMFDTSGISGTVKEAKLELTVNSDPGSGTLQVVTGANNNWAETTLTGSNKPAMNTVVIGEISGDFKLGQTISIPIDVSAIQGNTVTLIVTQSTGNDVAFASKENSVNKPPQLLVTYEAIGGKSAGLQSISQFKVYPNPAATVANLEGNGLKGSMVQLYTLTGMLVHSENAESDNIQIATQSLANGVYFVKTIDAAGQTNITRLAIDQ